MNKQTHVFVDLQIADDLDKAHPFFTQFACSDITPWFELALKQLDHKQAVECTVRIVSKKESQSLNSQYRQKDKPTNVLSFPSDIPDFVESSYIGDMLICIDIVCEEAQAQNKSIRAHFIHMCIHGLLHLLGYDHIEDNDAEEMEALERAILQKLGVDDPYDVQ
ncbi:rRNA maturation RNase YbeY [Agaribacter flavus]|uniref:Endoribonuclease YbeY n=1 Tax=Agaribacter flavus TaxID=1902781 RepID=A0ABV7FMU5_9ALTE